MWILSLGWEDPLKEEMAIHSGNSCMENPMERSLTGYSPQGCKESDLTESLSTLAQSIELRLWVLSRASLTSPSVNSNPLFLGFPDFVCPSLEEVS